MRTLMATTPSPFTLDSYGQTMVNLWHAASLRLTAGPESDDVLVQAAGHAVVAWLRQDAATPGVAPGRLQPTGWPADSATSLCRQPRSRPDSSRAG